MTETHSIVPAAPDWSRTPLGPQEAWPPALRLTVDIMLNTPLPMLLMWGSQHIMVYNPAYAELALPGTQKQAGAILPTLQPPAWSWNSAAIGDVWAGQAAVCPATELPVWRSGAAETLALDLHYTPVRGQDGEVAGVLCALAPAKLAPSASAAGGALRILVVEDNADAQYLVCETLRALGHEVRAALSAEDALPLLAEAYDVLFTDVSLPGMSGVELARHALRSHPAIAIMFASGYGDELTRHLEFPSRSLQKPYDIDQLQAALDDIGKGLQGQG
ncbi:response regulator [Oxalobacteraceae bacterium A2-2]